MRRVTAHAARRSALLAMWAKMRKSQDPLPIALAR